MDTPPSRVHAATSDETQAGSRVTVAEGVGEGTSSGIQTAEEPVANSTRDRVQRRLRSGNGIQALFLITGTGATARNLRSTRSRIGPLTREGARIRAGYGDHFDDEPDSEEERRIQETRVQKAMQVPRVPRRAGPGAHQIGSSRRA